MGKRAGCVHTHNAQRVIGSPRDPGWSVCRGNAEGELQQGPDWSGDTLSRRRHLNRWPCQGGPLLSGAALWWSQPRACPPGPDPQSGSLTKRSCSASLQPSIPQVPNYRLSMTIPDWLQAIQNYMKTLQYPSDQGLSRPSQGDGRGGHKPGGMSAPSRSANIL